MISRKFSRRTVFASCIAAAAASLLAACSSATPAAPMDPNFWGRFFVANLFRPLDDALKTGGLDASKWAFDVTKECTYKGKVQGLPLFEPHGVVWAVNTALIDKMGVKVPNPWPFWGTPEFDNFSWDKLVENFQATTKRNADGTIDIYGDSNTYSGWSPWIMMDMYELGGKVFDSEEFDEKQTFINSPEAVTAIQRRLDLMLKHKVSPPLGASQAYKEGIWRAQKGVSNESWNSYNIYGTPEQRGYKWRWVNQPHAGNIRVIMSTSSSPITTGKSLLSPTPRAIRDVGSLAGRYGVRALLYLILPLVGAVFAVPLLWLVSSSLKPESQVAAFPPNFIPNPIRFDNYPTAMELFPFWSSMVNTLVIVAGVMIGHLFTASFTAFAFARVRFPLREPLFALVLSTMMIPYYAYLLPQYLLFRDLQWLNSPLPLVVPSLFGQSPFYIFLFRQFFRTIPKEYDEAARIDGCGWFDIYWRIMLPLILPALGATAIFTFMGTWNDFLAPLIYLNEPKKQTLAIAIRTWEAFQAHGTVEHALRVHILAVSAVITIPPILLFFFAQRYFIQGVVVSGIKG